MNQFDTTGSGDISVGSPRIHLDDNCSHRDNHFCPACANFTPEETEAVRKHFDLLRQQEVDRG